MSSRDVPQWLIPAFVRSCRAAGATAPLDDLERAAQALVERWTAPDRHFHGLKHLIDILARVDELAAETHHPDLVRLAAWYHGAVFSSAALKAYARNAGEDYEASAQLAVENLTDLGGDPEIADRVAELILNLKRHQASANDIDAQALCDADLATLAATPQKYRAYCEAVRKEYAHIPARHYLEARSAVVSRLLERRSIFRSPLARAWEDPARENLSAELTHLEEALARLGECRAEDHLPPSPEHASEDALREARRDASVRRGVSPQSEPLVEVREDEVPAASTTRVLPLPTLPVPTEDEAPSAYAEDLEAAGIERHGAATEPVAEDDWDAAGSIAARPAAATMATDADHRSSLETGPEALFATLEAPVPQDTARQEDQEDAAPDAIRHSRDEESLTGLEEPPDEGDAPPPGTVAPAASLPAEVEDDEPHGLVEDADEDQRSTGNEYSSGIEREPELFPRSRRRR